MNFQKIILIIAFVILVVILGFMAYELKNGKSTVTWPPYVSPCPDYWIDISGGCFNSHNLGSENNVSGLTCNKVTGEAGESDNAIWYQCFDASSSTVPIIDFSYNAASGDWSFNPTLDDIKGKYGLFQDFSGQDNCGKYTWATGSNNTWDGITYGVPNPCSTTDTTTTT